MADYEVTRSLDCKGLPCPMPVVKIAQEIGKVAVGQVIEVLTTDPGSLLDFPAWAKSTGHAIVDSRQEAGLIRFYVKRQK